MSTEAQRKHFIEQLSDKEKQVICQAINTFGDGDHPVVTPQNMQFAQLSYVAHCLGRQHRQVIGSGLHKAPEYQDEKHLALNTMHDEILEKMNDACEFGV